MIPVFTEEQQMLQDSARETCADLQAAIKDRKPDYAWMWDTFAKLGWTGAVLPEELGGAGGSLLDAGIIALELGRANLFNAFPETAAVSFALSRHAKDANVSSLLKQVAAGTTALVLPHAVQDSTRPASPGKAPKGVYAAAVATARGPKRHFLVELIGGESPALIATPFEEKEGRAAKLTHRSGDKLLAAKSSGVAAGAIVLAKDKIARDIWDQATVIYRALSCVQLIGSARTLQKVAIDYAGVRAQFGHLINHFQAVQHTLVDIFGILEGAELLALKAVDSLGSGDARADVLATSVAYTRATVWTAMMKTYDIMGGIGFMEEHPISVYTRNMLPALSQIGTEESCYEAVSATVRKGGWIS